MVVDSNLHSLLDSAVKTAVYRLATSPDVHRQNPAPINNSGHVDRAGFGQPGGHGRPVGHGGHPSGHPSTRGQPIDRSRVDFLYYDGGMPEYEYYYYDDDYNELEKYNVQAPNSPPPWVAAHSKFNRFTKNKGYEESTYNKNNSNQQSKPQSAPALRTQPHKQPQPQDADERVDEGPISRVGSFLFNSPVGAFLPLIIAAPFIAFALYYLIVVNAPTPVVKERMGKAVDSAFATVKDVVLMAFDGGSKNTKYMDLISEGLSMLLNADSS